MSAGFLAFDPLLDGRVLLGLSVLVLGFLLLAIWRGLPGWLFRGLAASVLIAALLNPSWQREERDPQSDIALVVVDETSSQTITPRSGQTRMALENVASQFDLLNDRSGAGNSISARIVHVEDGTGADADSGSRVLSALAEAAASISPDRIAGAIIISDGRIDDAEALTAFPAPVHHLLTGRPDEWDRRLVLETAPAYAIVGESIDLGIRVETLGNPPAAGESQVPVFLSVDGAEPRAFSVPVGQSFRLPLELLHGGTNVLQLIVPDAVGELTNQNNQAIVSINGIRDRLRVLLVSGEPYAGERTWRNLLKADPAVDLVHFTILRPPSKQDGVPVFELSLIAFPTRELFMEKINEFDLIIFDRYRNRDVLPNLYLENVVNYVRDGGALLVASGPTFAGADSLFRSPLGAILPAAPTGQVFEEGYVPTVSELGDRHPVTGGLAAATGTVSATGEPAAWGRWFRLVETEPLRGQVLMTGLEDRALLVLDRVGRGRIAQLGSDHAWLWSRGFEGGGPQLELLRRLAHWLMKEPELEEEILSAETSGADVTITRRSLGEVTGDISVTGPDGGVAALTLTETGPGAWQASFAATLNGLYQIENGAMTAVAAVGPAAPREFVNAISTADILAALVATTRGATVRLDDGVPEIRLVRDGRVSAGNGWIGLARRGAYQVTDITLTPLAPAWLMLALALVLSLAAWRIEGR